MDRERDALRIMERRYETISPFEFKDKLIRLARENGEKSARALLDAGRGNPNWIAAAPRDAFFALGQFAVAESRRTWHEGHLAGMPEKAGISERFRVFAAKSARAPGVDLLRDIVRYGVDVCGFAADEWVHELADGVIGDNYPTPDRMLAHAERIAHDFLAQELCGRDPGAEAGKFRIFAVEGATAAMCYIFDSLTANRLLSRGDRVAVMVPIFAPYIEIPRLARYDFDTVEIRASINLIKT